MKKRPKSKIPLFKSKAEEAEFWDTHSFADYWNEFKDFDMIVELHKPKDSTVILRLQRSLKEQLERTARAKGLNVSTLARMWLMEKLRSTKH